MESALKTKYKLANALKELVGREPLDKITVKQIVEGCGVSRQTFYRCFLDKYDLVNWYFERLVEQSFKEMGVSLTQGGAELFCLRLRQPRCQLADGLRLRVYLPFLQRNHHPQNRRAPYGRCGVPPGNVLPCVHPDDRKLGGERYETQPGTDGGAAH